MRPDRGGLRQRQVARPRDAVNLGSAAHQERRRKGERADLLKDVDCPEHGDVERDLRVHGRVRREGDCGEVGDRVGPGRGKGVANVVSAAHVHIGMDGDYFMPCAGKLQRQPSSDEAGCAGNQDAHQWSSRAAIMPSSLRVVSAPEALRSSTWAGTKHWIDTRSQQRDAGPVSEPVGRHGILRFARWLLLLGLVALGATVLIAAWRLPDDPLALVGLAGYVAILGALLAELRLGRVLDERRASRQAGQTRMLQGMSRSVSPEAIVDTFVHELRHSADADHIVVARLRPVERVVETTLVSSRALLPPARSILPAGVLEPQSAGRLRSRRGLSPASVGGDAAQAVVDSLATRLGQTYALSHTLAAPLVADGRLVGALILSRRQEREWSTSDRRLLAFSAGELSAALARAFAFEAAETRANMDALTGLPNRRYLEELLATVGPRRRSGDQLGALMIDLDHFKRLNDRYGHATGDRVLRAVAERISAAVRADDTPTRYGGEEFAVVLRRADPRQAVEVAERIREQIGLMSTAELGVQERVTVSIGVAVADSHVTDPTSLLGDADDALYRAKREGRNRVVLAASL